MYIYINHLKLLLISSLIDQDTTPHVARSSLQARTYLSALCSLQAWGYLAHRGCTTYRVSDHSLARPLCPWLAALALDDTG